MLWGPEFHDLSNSLGDSDVHYVLKIPGLEIIRLEDVPIEIFSVISIEKLINISLNKKGIF